MPAKKKKATKDSPKSPRTLTLIPLLGLILAWLTFGGTGPTLYESDAAATGDNFTVKVTNKGRRTAEIGNIWCAAGAFLEPGTAKLTKLVTASPDIFRRSTLAPDQQEIVDMLVPISVTPGAAARMNNPSFLQLNSSTNWVVACRLPYWDKLDKWKFGETWTRLLTDDGQTGSNCCYQAFTLTENWLTQGQLV